MDPDRGGRQPVAPAILLTGAGTWSYPARVRPAAPIDGWPWPTSCTSWFRPIARSISFREATQLPGNRYVVVRNPRDPERRRLLIGATDGGRALTLVIEETVHPTTWLLVTGWSATLGEA